LAPPIDRQALEKVITLDVIVVITWRGIRGVKVYEVKVPRFDCKDVLTDCRARWTTLYYDLVVVRHRLDEKISEGHSQKSATVVVPKVSDSEYAAGLFSRCCQTESCDG
jgi:hypothetical protein